MKYNRKLLEELTLQKIKEINDEAGYRKYLEVPEMVNIVASIIEEKFVDNRWEACADELYGFADIVYHTNKNCTANTYYVEIALQAINNYKHLKQENELAKRI